MSYIEKKGDLFSTKINQLAHCVSVDFHMNAGIAKEFRKRYGRIDDLLSQNVVVGEVGILYLEDDLTMNDLTIYYLVTKERYFHKPTIVSLRNSLKSLRDIMLLNEHYDIAMPKIGCGLDRLNWEDVKLLIQNVLVAKGINVTIYKL